jgi:hypothetical protein
LKPIFAAPFLALRLENPQPHPLAKPVAMTGRLNLFEIPDSLVYVDQRIMSPAAS